MYGDFSRLTFAPLKHRTRVLQQQGRVLCDADWNEQTDILLHLMRGLAADVIGPHGGPGSNCGFAVVVNARSVPDEPPGRRERIAELLKKRGLFVIGRGRYYVDGQLCENGTDVHVVDQPGWSFDMKEVSRDGTYLIYLDVWEAFVSPVQDESTVEVALGGLETAARARAVWAVKVHPIDDDVVLDPSPDPRIVEKTRKEWAALVEAWQPERRGLLRARATQPPSEDMTACSIDPEARFRGDLNGLFRVEIHDGGVAWPDADAPRGKKQKSSTGAAGVDRATFKFSRVNGSAVFAVDQLDGNEVTLHPSSRESRIDLQPNAWVEIVDDDTTKRGKAGPLRRVSSVDVLGRRVMLEPAAADAPTGTDPAKHPFLRRWEGIVNVVEGEGDQRWISLESGVQVQFQKAADDAQHVYRPGDYWLIPARVVTGDVEWPRTDGRPDALPPFGVTHAFAPLAILTRKADGTIKKEKELRRQFDVLAQTVADV